MSQTRNSRPDHAARASRSRTAPRFRAAPRFALALLVGAVLAAPLAVEAAAPSPGLRVESAQRVSDTLVLSSLSGGSEALLDWRTPVREFGFTLPPADWTESLTLTLSADPIGGSPQEGRQDILVSLNGAAPERLELSRRGFVAELDLPTSALRAGTNTLRLALAPRGACLSAADGGWDVDLARSTLETTARAQSRSLFLADVEDLFARPRVGELTVGVRAFGDRDALDALIVQGAALRASAPLRVRLDRPGDIEVIAGTRAQIASQVGDRVILDGTGALVAVHEGRPARLVITGDTEAEVREGVDAFAVHHLPRQQRRVTSPGALELSPRLGGERAQLARRTGIGALGGLDFSGNWGAGADSVRFDVPDPADADARVVLDFRRADFVAPESHVDVEINGRPLGRTVLDASRVKMDAHVPQGWLRGRDNVLRVEPDLRPASGYSGGEGCAPSVAASGLNVAKGSRIELRGSSATAATDLAALVATGGRLADARGEGTQVLLPAARADREAALAILGQLSKSVGEGLTAARYGSEGDAVDADADLLAFGRAPEGVKMPRNVALAARGGADGVVGLFPESGRWVGLFAPAPGRSLATVRSALAGESWNDLQGGVMRVRRAGTPELVQTAFADPSGESPADGGSVFAALDLSGVGEAIASEYVASRTELAQAWSGMDIRLPSLRRFTEVGPDALRGRFEVSDERAAPLYSLRAEPGRLTMGFGGFRAGVSGWGAKIERFIARGERKAAQMRRDFGLEGARLSGQSWMRRNVNFLAMLLMLGFGLSVWMLMRADWKGR